jgi:hypothetical protein
MSIANMEQIGQIIIDIIRERIGVLGDVISVERKAICSTSQKNKLRSALQITAVSLLYFR